MTLDAIFVPRGSEENAVRGAAARAGSNVRIFPTGIGPRAAELAVEAARHEGPLASALVTGLCGALDPAFAVGETLLYGTALDVESHWRDTDAQLSAALQARLHASQSGIRGLSTDRILTERAQKALARERFGAQAVDMESFAMLRALRADGTAVAIVRVVSDGAADALPDLNRALTGSGEIDPAALALAMLGSPLRAVGLAFSATRALATLRRAIERMLASDSQTP